MAVSVLSGRTFRYKGNYFNHPCPFCGSFFWNQIYFGTYKDFIYTLRFILSYLDIAEKELVFFPMKMCTLCQKIIFCCALFFKIVSGTVVEWLLCPKKSSFFTENMLFICPENVGKYFCWKKIMCFVRIRALIDYWQIDELLLGKCSPCHLLCSFIIYYKCTPFVIS